MKKEEQLTQFWLSFYSDICLDSIETLKAQALEEMGELRVCSILCYMIHPYHTTHSHSSILF